jgi:hypothetical protein
LRRAWEQFTDELGSLMILVVMVGVVGGVVGVAGLLDDHRDGSTRTTKVPIGATARCVDGSYSYSTHRQGTCSWHDGVAEWLR